MAKGIVQYSFQREISVSGMQKVLFTSNHLLLLMLYTSVHFLLSTKNIYPPQSGNWGSFTDLSFLHTMTTTCM
jgi:hypothetical protein